MSELAVVVVDAQRGFMPKEEGEMLGVPGFGELAVPRGAEIVPAVNILFDAAEVYGVPTVTTQDFHPEETAHFSGEPNYKGTWPVHCVAGTPGAELHPAIELRDDTERFYKGTAALQPGEDDRSYSGFTARNRAGRLLGDHLRAQGVKEIDVLGLAFDVCVGETALDGVREGFKVNVVLEGTRGLGAESEAAMRRRLEQYGVRIIRLADALSELALKG